MTATFVKDAHSVDIYPAAAVTAGDLVEFGALTGAIVRSAEAEKIASVRLYGEHKVSKTANIVLVRGQLAYEIFSTGAASHYAPGRKCLGMVSRDAAASDTEVHILFGKQPTYLVDLRETTASETVVGSATVLPIVGGGAKLNLINTNEAEKASILPDGTFSILQCPIAEFRVARVSASAAAVDMDWGIGSGDHASDFESITNFVAFHTDGGDNNIDAHSKDAVANVAITDTAVDQTDAAYDHFLIDARDRTSVKLYINGIRVLSGSTLALPASATTLKAIVHTEKTSGTATGELRVERLLVWANVEE